MGVGVDQPGQHHPVVVAGHLGAGEAAGQLLEGPDGQDLAAGEGDRPALQLPGRAHGQHVPAADHADPAHERLLCTVGGG
jgi:hypothetical protein